MKKLMLLNLKIKRKNTDYEFIEIANSMPIPKQTRMKNFLRQLKWKKIRKRIQQKCLQKWTEFYPKKYHFY